MVLSFYPLKVQETVPLGSAGGFSGAGFWQVFSENGVYCLRRWPPDHPVASRLQRIHDVLYHAYRLGLTQLALPLKTLDGRTFVASEGFLWELAPWMPGEADYRANPSRARLDAAMSVLARFHAATASFGRHRMPGLAPGIQQRLKLLTRFLDQDQRALLAAIATGRRPEIDQRARQIVAAFRVTAPGIHASLKAATEVTVPIQPCLRDIWHDHVLFTGDEVTGIVDFGAVGPDGVAADIARLLGSLVGQDQPSWALAMEAYCRTRPLSFAEAAMVPAFHAGNLALSGMNWLRWIYLEGRQFESWPRVIARLDENLAALHGLQLAADR